MCAALPDTFTFQDSETALPDPEEPPETPANPPESARRSATGSSLARRILWGLFKWPLMALGYVILMVATAIGLGLLFVFLAQWLI